jgi:SCY1-like protein 1
VNDSCGSTHGNVRSSSIFISPSGEWKLGGFEALSSPTDEAAVLYVCLFYYRTLLYLALRALF